MRPGNASGDSQPEPSAAVIGCTRFSASGVVQPHQTIEDPFPVRWRYSWSAVGHAHPSHWLRIQQLVDRDADFAAVGGIPPGVVQQVSQHLCQPLGIPGDGYWLAIDPDGELRGQQSNPLRLSLR
jgi:hypothetical protein